jgi:tetratricopeptide (TPR) repeat protein
MTTWQILNNQLIQDNSLIWKALTSDVWAFKGDGTIAASNYWRPTFTAWHILNYRLFGANPYGWHILNLLLHAGVCVLAYALLRRWQFSAMIACAIALIFAVHPVHVESVAWISGSPDLLFALAFLASLWFAQNYAEKPAEKTGARDLIFSLALYAVALGAKEIGILCLPIYYVILSDKQGSDKKARPFVPQLLSYLAVAAVYFIARMSILGAISRRAEDAASLQSAILSVPEMFAFYLRQIFFPYWMSASYPLQPVVQPGLLNFVVPLLVSLAALAGIFYIARKSKTGKIAALIFILPLLPAMNATAFIQIVHDRYLYLPLLGILMLIALFVTKFLNEQYILIAGTLLSLLLCFQTFTYNRAWANDFELWSWSSKVDNSAFTWTQYGEALSEQNKLDEAIRAHTNSINTQPTTRGYLARGRTYLKKKQYPESEKDLTIVLATPDEKVEAYALYQAYEAIALLYSEQRKYDEAIKKLEEGRRKLPIYSASLTTNLAIVLYQKGLKDVALRELEGAKAQARKEFLPESKAAFLRLGMLYAELGRKAEARSALQEYLGLTANFKDKFTLEDRSQANKVLKGLN